MGSGEITRYKLTTNLWHQVGCISMDASDRIGDLFTRCFLFPSCLRLEVISKNDGFYKLHNYKSDKKGKYVYSVLFFPKSDQIRSILTTDRRIR